ncbi:MAG: outer membrane protein transport protein [Bacteroidales bacterium]|nr:outer membrane protein transport protein [Bacteroidales bacterium]
MKKNYLLFFALAISMGIYAQSGTIMISNDAQSAGRGGTSIGVFNSYELMMSNPAGLAFVKDASVDVGLSLMQSNLHFKNTINDKDGETGHSPMPNLGYINKSGKENSKWTWGLGVFTQGGMGADFSLKNELYRAQTFELNSANNTYYPLKGAYDLQDYHSKFAVMEFGPSVAFKLNEKLAIGASLHAVYSLMEFQMPFGMNPSIMQGAPMPGLTFGQLFSMDPSQGGFGYQEVNASANMSDLSTISWTGKVGIAYKPNAKLSIGLNFNLPIALNFKKGKATMDMSKQFEDAMGRAVYGFYQDPNYSGVPLQTALAGIGANFAQMGIDLSKGVVGEYDLDLKMKMPLSIGYGMSYQTSPKFNIAFDVVWTNWANAFDKMEMTMTNGTNSNINTMIGGTGFSFDFPLKWKNNVTLKVGGEYAFTDQFTYRLGYAYNSNPTPESNVFAIFPAIVMQHLTMGGSYKISNKFLVNAAVEAGLNNKLTATDPSDVQSEFSGSTSELKTLIGHLSLTYKL